MLPASTAPTQVQQKQLHARAYGCPRGLGLVLDSPCPLFIAWARIARIPKLWYRALTAHTGKARVFLQKISARRSPLRSARALLFPSSSSTPAPSQPNSRARAHTLLCAPTCDIRIGYYCSADSTETACPAGKYGGSPGLQSLSDCTDCVAGEYCVGQALTNAPLCEYVPRRTFPSLLPDPILHSLFS